MLGFKCFGFPTEFSASGIWKVPKNDIEASDNKCASADKFKRMIMLSHKANDNLYLQ